MTTPQSEREIAAQILRMRALLQQTHDAILPEPSSDDMLSTSSNLLTLAHTVAEWLAQRDRDAIFAFLIAHDALLLDHHAIVLLTLLGREEADPSHKSELHWRRDLLIRARQVGIARAWEDLPS
jgi:hypothetical protein